MPNCKRCGGRLTPIDPDCWECEECSWVHLSDGLRPPEPEKVCMVCSGTHIKPSTPDGELNQMNQCRMQMKFDLDVERAAMEGPVDE